MSELYNGCFFPLTKEIGFLECDLATAADAFTNWQKDIQAKRGVEVVCTPESQESLKKILPTLLPLTSVERRRHLFIETKGIWTAYIDNGWRGTDAFAPISYLAQAIGCRGLRVCYTPHSSNRFGSVMLEIYSAETQPDFSNTIRSIAVLYDGSRWEFHVNGTVQNFEQTEQYKNRLIKNRFTAKMLDAYLKELGIFFFDEQFYDASKAFLIEKQGPTAPQLKEYNLEDLQ